MSSKRAGMSLRATRRFWRDPTATVHIAAGRGHRKLGRQMRALGVGGRTIGYRGFRFTRRRKGHER